LASNMVQRSDKERTIRETPVVKCGLIEGFPQIHLGKGILEFTY
jgi:hypothetical protein